MERFEVKNHEPVIETKFGADLLQLNIGKSI